jgi:hypothetical protein
MALSMYRDRPEFGPLPVHGQGRIWLCPFTGTCKIRACPCTRTEPYMSMYRDMPKFGNSGMSLYMDRAEYGPVKTLNLQKLKLHY